MSLTAFTDAVIFTGEAFVEGHALLVKDGLVVDLVAGSHVPAGSREISCRDRILVPGFVDCQVNGGGGVLFNETPTVEGALAIAKAHARRGTTSLLLTCISDDIGVMRRALEAMRAARKVCTGILGIHFEGPHLGAARKGVHREAFLRDMTEEDIALYRPEGGEVILVTLAPERVATDDIRKLAAQGTRIALGHSAATTTQVRGALAAGATGFTHLFNAMSPMSAREPGMAGVALDSPAAWCGIIADGAHVSAEMIRLAWRTKTSEKLFFVSDAMPPAGCDAPQDFRLYGEDIHTAAGRCMTREGTLAGAALTLGEQVRHGVTQITLEPDEVLRMVTASPADFLGKKAGRLVPGTQADVVALDHVWAVREILTTSHTCHSRVGGNPAACVCKR